MTAPPSADSGDPAPDRARTWRTHRGRLTPGACTAALFSSCPGTRESRILREGVGFPNLTATPSSPIFHISGRPGHSGSVTEHTQECVCVQLRRLKLDRRSFSVKVTQQTLPASRVFCYPVWKRSRALGCLWANSRQCSGHKNG